MSQLACPLCGRYVSLSRFDPSGFDNDIYAVDMVGLGRGRGFAVGPRFSVLDDVSVTGPIASRCHVILGLIEGRDVKKDDILFLDAENKRLNAEILKKERAEQELYAQIVDLEIDVISLRGDVARYESAQDESASIRAGLSAEVDALTVMVEWLQTENKRLKSLCSELEDDADNEGELLAMDEMEALLDRINVSANTDFGYLDDAISYLLEGS